MRRLLTVSAVPVALLLAFMVGGHDGSEKAAAVQSTVAVQYGPITVPASGLALNTVPIPPPADCTNLGCYITQIVPDLVYMNDIPPYTNGAISNYNNDVTANVWLHHSVLFDPCVSLSAPPFFASGNERSVGALPAGYGYQVFPGCTSWVLNYHIHNSGSTAHSVAVKFTFTYRTGEVLTPVTPIWLDTGKQANSSEFTIGTGLSDTHTGGGGAFDPTQISADYTTSVQGTIVSIGGHVHDYGISVSAFNTRSADYICTSVSGYGTGSRYLPTGGAGTGGHAAAGVAQTLNAPYYHQAGVAPDDRYHIQSMTPCNPTPRQSVVCIGDVIRLHTEYNNTSGAPIFDAMGIIVAYVAPMPDANNNGIQDGCDPADSDADKFSDRTEWLVGTSRTAKCGVDAWPADINNDGFSDITDISALAGSFGKSVPPAPARHNIAPDPPDTFVDITDISKMAGEFGRSCSSP